MSLAVEADRRRSSGSSRRMQQPRGRRLAAAGLADEAERLAPHDVERRRRRRPARRRPGAGRRCPARIGKCLTRSRTSTSGLAWRRRSGPRSRRRSSTACRRHRPPRRGLVGLAARAAAPPRARGASSARSRHATWWSRGARHGLEQRVDLLVRLAHVRAARVERAARRQVDQRRRPARDRHELLVARRVQARDRLQQAPRVGVLGRREDRVRVGRARRSGPAYITAMSSAISATTPRSWVIITIAVSSSLCRRCDQLEDLRLHGHVERRRRLVGDQQLRVVDQRHRDHHALAHAAGELVRVGVDAPARLGDADQRRASRPRGRAPAPWRRRGGRGRASTSWSPTL